MFNRNNNNYFYFGLFLSTLFVIIGCSKEPMLNKDQHNPLSNELAKHTNYVEGEGYCVGKYDKRGCNLCSLQYLENSSKRWSWICTQKYCLEENKKRANQCVSYL